MKTAFRLITALLLAIAACASTTIQETDGDETSADEGEEEKAKFSAGTFAGLKLRGLGCPNIPAERRQTWTVEERKPQSITQTKVSGSLARMSAPASCSVTSCLFRRKCAAG